MTQPSHRTDGLILIEILLSPSRYRKRGGGTPWGKFIMITCKFDVNDNEDFLERGTEGSELFATLVQPLGRAQDH